MLYLFSSVYYLNNYYTSDICHLLICGVGVKIATDILCECDGCQCKLLVSRQNYMWTVYKWKVPHCVLASISRTPPTIPTTKSIINNKGLIMLEWNASGLTSMGHGDEIKAFLINSSVTIGIVCIQQTWFLSKKKVKQNPN